MKAILAMAMVAMVLALGMAACGDVEPPPIITANTIQSAENRILQLHDVQDVYIEQSDREIVISIISNNTDPDFVKILGAEAVRIMMRTNPHEKPTYGGGSRVGQGVYDYRVGVGNFYGEIIESGIKLSGGATIFW